MAPSFKRAVRAVTGMRAALVILVLLLVLSVTGSIIPQGNPALFYAHHFPRLHPLILVLQLDRIYSSPLFWTLGVLLGISLLVCTVRRLRSAATVRAYVSAVVHVSLLVMLGGGMASGTGFTGKLVVSGQSYNGTARAADGSETVLPFSVKLDSFSVEQVPGKPVSDYCSRVQVQRGGVADAYDIRMNRPVTVAGYTLNQSGFFKNYVPVLVLSGAETLTVARPSTVPGTAFKVRIRNVYPDFVLDGRNPGTRSNEPRNPFVLLEVTRNMQRFAQCYYSVNNKRIIPRTAFGKKMRTSRLLRALNVTGCTLHEEYVSVLGVTRDPGAPWVLGGGTVLMLGMTALFMLRSKDEKRGA